MHAHNWKLDVSTMKTVSGYLADMFVVPVTMYKYKYNMYATYYTDPRRIDAPLRPSTVHVRVQRAHPSTLPHVQQTWLTPTQAHSRAIGAPLRWPMPNTVNVHVRCAHSIPLTCNRCTAQAAHNRCIAHFCTTSTPLGPYMPNAVYARIHELTTIRTPLGLHMTTAVHAQIHAHTYKCAPFGLLPYAHPRKMRLPSSSKYSDRTLRSRKQYAAAQHCTSTWSYIDPVRVL